MKSQGVARPIGLEAPAGVGPLETDDPVALAVFKALRVLVAVVDARGIIRSINRKWRERALELGGYGALEMVGEGADYLDVCARSAAAGDELARKVEQGLAAVLRHEADSFSLEYPCNEAWYLLSAIPLPTSDGGAVVAHLEITDRKRRELEVTRRDEWHQLILGSTSDLISIQTSEPVFVFVSGACRRLLGYEPEEMVGRPVFEFVHPDDLERTLGAHRELAVSMESTTVIRRLRRKDGGHLWTETKIRIMEPVNGQEYRVAVTRDISVHKQADEQQAQLRRALERAAFEWRSTFDTIQSPILLLGADGRVRRINRAAQEMLGRDYRDVIGQPAADIGRGQPWDTVAALAKTVLESLSPELCEAMDEKREKTWEVEASVSAASDEAEVKVIVQVRDISKTAKLQESLRHSETMAALGAVVGGVAHEVRNPLFGMTAILDAFESRFGDRPEHHPYLPMLRTELRRMSDLMQALLDYGKPARLELAPREISEAIGCALEACAPLAEHHGVRLFLGPVVSGRPALLDVQRLMQAFRNIIENAIQHSPPGGRVVIEALPFTNQGTPWVRVSVRDQGPGFQPVDLPKVLEPFFSRREGGTGLGLSIVSRVIEGHGGRLGVANHPEGGAVVDLDFPCIRQREVG
ncbi:MAG TPA: PAS domain S-box protein [Thermoanaerobaculia bacterium]|nr:PAS domain S-box protein [Thermoanaerobaculia bacterium]